MKIILQSIIYLLFLLPLAVIAQDHSFYLDTASSSPVSVLFTNDVIYIHQGNELIKTDYDGTILWSKTGYLFTSMIGNGSFIFGIYKDSIFRLDTSGNLLWMKKFTSRVNPNVNQSNLFGSFSFDGTNLFIQNVQGAGFYHAYPSVIVVDTSGNVVRVACDSVTASPEIYPSFAFPSLLKGAWFGYHGNSSTFGTNLLRIDENGSFDSSSHVIHLAGQGQTLITKMMALPDSNYLILTNTFLAGGLYQNYFTCTKINEQGIVLWQNSYYDTTYALYIGDYRANDFTCDSSGNIYIVGQFLESTVTEIKTANMLLKLNSTGDIQSIGGWTFNYVTSPIEMHYRNGHFYCHADSITVTSRKKILIADFDAQFYNSCFAPDTVLHLDKIPSTITNGPLYTGFLSYYNPTPLNETMTITSTQRSSQPACAPLLAYQPYPEPLLVINPQPATSTIKISGAQKIKLISIYNSMAQLVNEKVVDDSNDILLMDISNLNPGIYFLKASGSTYEKFGKIIKQ
jgi:hypothetical protein